MSDSILVVGAGPVGLALAMALTRSGVEVRIIDRDAARTDKSKALVIWPRTLELLDIQGCPGGAYEAGYVYLIRPDAYVVTSAAGDDAGAVVSALERMSL